MVGSTRWLMVFLGLCLVGTTCLYGFGGNEHCDRCGCCSSCKKCCRLVCEMVEVTTTTWTCKCEDFCVPGPSVHHESCCNCGHCPACRAECWIPRAAYVKTRMVPVKQEVKVKRPSYKLVVEYLCPSCCEVHE